MSHKHTFQQNITIALLFSTIACIQANKQFPNNQFNRHMLAPIPINHHGTSTWGWG